MADYKWKPIEDLPDDWTKLASSELGGLAAVWREHYETIKDSKALKQFNERLRREWAIETGIIENLYYIDRGVTLTLIEKGIEASLIPHGTTDRPAELIVPILKDHEEVVTGLFDFVGQQRQLSTSYIKQLHQALTQHQRTTAAKDNFGTMMEVELLRGDWKKLPNNPTKSDDSAHEYCPPEQVASEMDRLILLHQEHLEKGVSPEVEAAWLHHRFTQIHPFQDGNGRMARTLASLIFLRARLFPLVIHRDDRDKYIDSLEIADKGELIDLIQLFSQTQKNFIIEAVSISKEILFEKVTIDDLIDAAVHRLNEKKQGTTFSFVLLQTLEQITEQKIQELSEKISHRLKSVDANFSTDLRFSDSLDVPNTESRSIESERISVENHHKRIALDINENHTTSLIFAFSSLGKTSKGIFLVTSFLKRRSAEGELLKTPFGLSFDAFQFAVTESEKEVLKRYFIWLDKVFLNFLNKWQSLL